MQVPFEIANKVLEYQSLLDREKELRKDIMEWLEANTDAESVIVGDIFIADAPKGGKQSKDGEYCDQHGDSDYGFYGTYYHKIENSEKYVAYTYECG